MRLSPYRALLCAALLVLTLAGTPASANETLPNCAASTVDNPHPSSSGIGIIAKARYRCTAGVSSLAYSLYLYLCVGGGPGQNCTIVHSSVGVIPAPVPGATYTRYVPDQPSVGMTGTGWWYADTDFYASTGSVLVPGYARSQDVYLSA